MICPDCLIMLPCTRVEKRQLLRSEEFRRRWPRRNGRFMFVQTNSVSFAQQTTDTDGSRVASRPCQARDIVWARGGGVEVEDGRPVPVL